MLMNWLKEAHLPYEAVRFFYIKNSKERVLHVEKFMSFLQKQKQFIWSRLALPSGETEEENRHFIELGELLGLNPRLHDGVFEMEKTTNRSLTTRDGLLLAASKSPDFVGAPIASDVREGDLFEIIPAEGTVRHSFGQKRGKILGAYAVLDHKRFRPCAVFVNFDEYFRANARLQCNGQGGSPIWDQLPSAMIVKVAETLVLRRQFPLVGMDTAEEMDMDLETEKNLQPLKHADSSSKQKEQGKENKDQKGFRLKHYQPGKSASGIPYAKLIVVDQQSKEEKKVFAKGPEALELTRYIPEDCVFQMDVRGENGSLFLEAVNGRKVSEAS